MKERVCMPVPLLAAYPVLTCLPCLPALTLLLCRAAGRLVRRRRRRCPSSERTQQRQSSIRPCPTNASAGPGHRTALIRPFCGIHTAGGAARQALRIARLTFRQTCVPIHPPTLNFIALFLARRLLVSLGRAAGTSNVGHARTHSASHVCSCNCFLNLGRHLISVL